MAYLKKLELFKLECLFNLCRPSVLNIVIKEKEFVSFKSDVCAAFFQVLVA